AVPSPPSVQEQHPRCLGRGAAAAERGERVARGRGEAPGKTARPGCGRGFRRPEQPAFSRAARKEDGYSKRREEGVRRVEKCSCNNGRLKTTRVK
ncbi:Hypothetical predicted protein, partial [Podarcis lilfordi]